MNLERKILISHRGNINGKNELLENNPDYIEVALSKGYDVEIDLWIENDGFYLGHDAPTYPITLDWLIERSLKLWVHCKDFTSLSELINTEMRIFYHQNEDYTIISDGHIWAHNLTKVDDKCIIPLLNKKELKNWKGTDVYGICSDYVGVW